jgi:hypothetical protein
MVDFWRPFLFGAGWLALALAFLWLLGRGPERRLSLRNRTARVLAAILAGLALAIFVTGLPFSLGFCRGGLDGPLICSVLPVALVEGVAPLSLLLAFTGLVVAPGLGIAILFLERPKRRRQRAGQEA